MSGLSASVSATAVGAPVAPQNVKAAVYGERGIRLSWTASPGATQYNIYRYNGAKKDYVYIGTAYKAAYYEGGLVPGVTYYYKVNAVCKTAVSTWVSGFPAAANAKAVGKPAAPKNLKAAPYGEKGVRLTWTASPGATSYYVYRYNGAEQQYVYIGAADKAAYYDGSRAVGVTYYYRVRAVCRIDGTAYIGDYSAAASAKAVGTPAVPQGLKAVPYNDNSIHVSWTASPGATQYNVYRYNGAKQAYVYIGTATGTAYRDGGLVPGTTYYYKVNAVCKANGSTWVSGFPAAVSAKAVGAPVAPQNLKAAQYGESGIRLSWTASPGATGYRVYRYDEDEEGYVSIGATTKAAYYDGNLWGGVTYYYVVKAVHRTSAAAYESGWSSVAGATLPLTINQIWKKLEGDWLKNLDYRVTENDECFRFYQKDGKYRLLSGWWRSEAFDDSFVDNNTIKGDPNGIVTLSMTSPGYFDEMSGNGKWVPESKGTVSIDLSKQANDKIQINTGRGWTTYYRYRQTTKEDLSAVWDQLLGGIWSASDQYNNYFEFSKRDGKLCFEWWLWFNSDAGYVDFKAVDGYYKGNIYLSVMLTDHYHAGSGTEWGSPQASSFIFDFSNINNGRIRIKTGEVWDTYTHRS